VFDVPQQILASRNLWIWAAASYCTRVAANERRGYIG
jgi:hypothetical protein